jgi:predicted phosphate transport protein (TIGR00153 family)
VPILFLNRLSGPRRLMTRYDAFSQFIAARPLSFFSRGESSVLNLVISNLDFVIGIAKHLPIVIDGLGNHDRAKTLGEVKIIGEMETQADEMHQRAVRAISGGSFFGGIREDVLKLLEDIDNIADAVKDSSRIFAQRNIPFDTIDYWLREDVMSFINKLIESCEELKIAVLTLAEKNVRTKVVELAAKVEKKEEEADEIRGTILDNLLKNEIRADSLDIILLKQFLEIADNIADSAEDASEVLVVLIAKGYS